MKTQQIEVSRTIEIPGQKDEQRSTKVSFRNAENGNEMLQLCGGDLAKAMSYFNAGRWAELRTKVSNALANKTPQQRAVDKMIAAFQSINPSLSESQVRTIVLAMPNMSTAVGVSSEVLPKEIDENYFDEIKAAKKGNGSTESESENEPAA